MYVTTQDHVIEVEHGWLEFTGRPVLRDLELTVAAGDVVALLGENGSGKSTLVRAVLGLNPLTSGSVRLFGTPLGEFRAWSRVGYVPQRSTAASGVPATVAEVVAAGRLARRRPFLPTSRADRAAVREALETVGLPDRAGDSLNTLSGGQQQRALIARALAGEAELLLLDEPTAGVDAANQHALAGALQRLADRGTTLVVVLHELGALAPLITRAVTVCDGRAVEDHTHGGHAHHHEEAPAPIVPTLVSPLDPGEAT